MLAERLQTIAKELVEGREVQPLTVREFLSWFGALRRGNGIVENIRKHLAAAQLATEPDFESAYIDSHIAFVPAARGEPAPTTLQVLGSGGVVIGGTALVESVSGAYRDPTYRISKLASANTRPLSVRPDTSLAEAVTLMLQNDFSQLPVMTGDRDVKGIVSWFSIGSRLALGKSGGVAREMMQSHQEVSESTSIFQAIPLIVRHDYVLVRANDGRVSGIVTASDLSVQFQNLSEPFLLLSEIENQVRRILEPRFSASELAAVRNDADSSRKVERVSDLTFGEYIRLLEVPENWQRLGASIDRIAFCRELDHVRQIRNDVVHFDPDGIPATDLEKLRQFSVFLQRLRDLGAL